MNPSAPPWAPPAGTAPTGDLSAELDFDPQCCWGHAPLARDPACATPATWIVYRPPCPACDRPTVVVICRVHLATIRGRVSGGAYLGCSHCRSPVPTAGYRFEPLR